jgi:hypothetical protein
VLLVMVAVTSVSCSVATHKPSTVAPRVLGEQSGTPVVVGQPAPAGTGELSAVSCADAHHCWAVGVAGPNAPATTTTGPSSAVTVIAGTANGGLTWAAQPLTMNTIPALTGVSCPTARVCMAVGSNGSDPSTGVVLTTQDGGRSWAPSAPPVGAIAVTSVQCVNAATCTLIVSDGTAIWSAVTQDFGISWQRQGDLPAGLGGALSLSCSSGGGTCLVSGFTPTTSGHGQGGVAISTDGGMTWAAATVPAGVGLLESATCDSPTRCLAVGTTSTTISDVVPAKGLLLVSADGGHTWTDSPAPVPVDDAFAVDCPSATGCAMVGTKWVGTPAVGTGAVARSNNAGATFTASTTAYTPLTLTALACPSAVLCVAAGGDTVARITLTRPPSPKAKKERVRAGR